MKLLAESEVCTTASHTCVCSNGSCCVKKRKKLHVDLAAQSESLAVVAQFEKCKKKKTTKQRSLSVNIFTTRFVTCYGELVVCSLCSAIVKIETTSRVLGGAKEAVFLI